jgi:hypothetical protein
MGELTPADLVALAEILAEDADQLSDAFARELADVLRRLERRLPEVISEATSGRTGSAVRAAALGRARANLRRLLTEAGYDDLIDTSVTVSVDRALARLAATSEAYRQALAFDTTGRPTAFTGLLRALVETGREDLRLWGDELATALWRATARGVLGAEPPARLIASLTSVLDGQRARAATLYDTNVSIVQRVAVQTIVPTLDATINDPTAPAPLATGGDVLPVPEDQLYAYVGPVDSLIRPFCLRHIGKVYTRAEIEALDNEQLPNPFLTGGGYNCRHLWAPISRFSASADLRGTDGRLPEVEAELARVRPQARTRTLRGRRTA